MSALVVAVDAMGGDYGPRCTVPACIDSLKKNPALHIYLVGQQEALEKELALYPKADISRLTLQLATESIAMDAVPSAVLRNHAETSMGVALELVRSGIAGACVSAGNTGALMGISKTVLKMIPGIARPAIMTAIPTRTGKAHLLDLGANVNSSAEHLYQFALLGALTTEASGMRRPTVALLNVGREQIKGNPQVKEAHDLLKDLSAINYIGYIEGDDVFAGAADVVVCDGFVGNILLKATEGLAQMIGGRIRQELGRGLRAGLLAWLAAPVWRALEKDLAPERYNGACMLGLNGIVIKSHGGAKRDAFQYAIKAAVQAIEEDLPSYLQQHLHPLLEKCDGEKGAGIE